MKGSILVLRPNDSMPERREFERPVELAELRTAVGGDLEVVPDFDTIAYGGTVLNCVAFCDEHSKLSKLPINHYATMTWERALRRAGLSLYVEGSEAPRDWLCGTVAVIFGDREFMAGL